MAEDPTSDQERDVGETWRRRGQETGVPTTAATLAHVAANFEVGPEAEIEKETRHAAKLGVLGLRFLPDFRKKP